MHPRAKAERKRVFEAYRDIFAGKNAHIRQGKAIARVVQQHYSPCKALITDYGINKLVCILKGMLVDRIFNCEERARKEFPEFFSKRSQAISLGKHGESVAIEETQQHAVSHTRLRAVKHNEPGDSRRKSGRDTSHEASVSSSGSDASSALRLLQFPFETQHSILLIVQQLLEESCFNFVKRWLPSLLDEKGWDCAAAGELTKWLYLLRQHAKNLPDGCMGNKGRGSLMTMIPTIARLRHTAVHRLHLTPEELLDQIHSACKLVELLQDVGSASKVRTLHARIEHQKHIMESNARDLQQDVDSMLLIRQQKEILIQKEQLLISRVAQRQTEVEATAGRALIESINTLLTSDESSKMLEKPTVRHDEDVMCTSYSMIVNEDDIESDEDQLRAELE